MPLERLPVKIFKDDTHAALAVAQRMARLIRARAEEGRPAVLGLATGHTPVKVYQELIRLHREEGLDLSHCVTFNLDEYWPISHEAVQSYHVWMAERLFDHVNIRPENIHIPSGEVPEAEAATHCEAYERAIEEAGGIDIQLLGIGRSGHIGFNEPGSARNSRTRRIDLDFVTRKDAAGDFFGEENVPRMAITMGVGTILKSREVCLMAFGEHKAAIVRRAVEEEITRHVAASFLQSHPNAAFYLDASAGAALTRMATPWLTQRCEWDRLLQRKAVIWLARKTDKAILKLTDEDYQEHGLSGLLREKGEGYDNNVTVFRHLMNTVTIHPAGKSGPKRVLIFSPHPDDDVICMGGTMARLVGEGHDTHVAYMVSGYLSVFDHNVIRHTDFVREFRSIFSTEPDPPGPIDEHVDAFLARKKPGDVDTPEVRAIKALIRKTEAIAGAKVCGLKDENIHFLDLPFYDTGKVGKLSVGEEDVAGVRKSLETVRPEIVFAAGDMSDPHGTHRLCLQALTQALDAWVADGAKRPELWFYRGAWQEWEPDEIDRAVPLSPDDVRRKRDAIFRHESQKDRAMFPGPYDTREFWQRAEDRNSETAETYDSLGLPEFCALEAFVRHPKKTPRTISAQLTAAKRM